MSSNDVWHFILQIESISPTGLNHRVPGGSIEWRCRRIRVEKKNRTGWDQIERRRRRLGFPPTRVENGGRSRRCVPSSIAGARKETERSAALISNNQLSPPSLSPSLFWSSRVERKRKIQKEKESATVAIIVWVPPVLLLLPRIASCVYQLAHIHSSLPDRLDCWRSSKLLSISFALFRIHSGIFSQPKNKKINLINSSVCDCVCVIWKFRIWIWVFDSCRNYVLDKQPIFILNSFWRIFDFKFAAVCCVCVSGVCVFGSY